MENMTKRETKKSIIYTFRGWSRGYNAYVQGAFYGTYVVPKKYAHLVQEGEELSDLVAMHEDRDRYPGIILRQAGRIQ